MDKRKVIGILVGGIADDFTVQTCRGAMRAAREKNVDVVILPGKYIERNLRESKDLMYEYQYNTIFSYARDGRFDALLVTSGSIGSYADETKLQAFLQSLEGVPCVLMGDRRDGYLSVSYDNYAGPKEGLEYLIEQLGCTNIVMAGGPDDNTDALERKNTFYEVMKKHGLEADERHFIAGDLSRKQKKLFGDYIDKNPGVEAFFCVNDDTAFGVYEALKERGIEIGKDVYVIGYDNTLQGAKAKPSLSTVMADANALGVHALELALLAMGDSNAESIMIPTRFIKRESCGKEKMKRKDAQLKRLDTAHIDDYFDEIFYRYVMEGKDNKLRTIFHTIMEMIIDGYHGDYQQDGTYAALPTLLEAFFRMGALEYADVENLLVHIEEVSDIVMEKCADDVTLQKTFRGISEIYRDVILSEEEHQGKMLTLEDQKNYDLKMFVTKSMQFEKGSAQSYEALLQNLDWLDIGDAVLYAYDKPIVHLEQETFQIPRHIYVKAVLHNGAVKTTFGKSQRKRSKEMFHNNLFENGSHAKVLLPLFSSEVLYGVLLCDMSEKLFENGEFLAGQLGTAMKMLHLLKTNEDIQNQYEESMVVLRENNIALDALAKSDGLTGILNRRGFTEEATKRLEQFRGEKDTLVAYIDMNNLKIINDRYGHDEGDFSIRTISQLLREIFPKGIVGRIGGDEFALLTEYTGEELENLKYRVYNVFRVFNAGTDKAYNVMVSAGFYVIGKDSETELADALAFADEKLYIEKQNRPKVVAKDAEV